jgi:Cu(I)/Ag(I) efflux system membrane fusion protein
MFRSTSHAIALFGLLVAVAYATLAGAESGTQDFDQRMQPILESYLRIGEALSSDSLDGVRKNAESIAKSAKALEGASVSGKHAEHYKDISANLTKAALALSAAQALPEAREAFKKLSQPMAMWATMSKPKQVDVVYCSMAKASWVQKHGKIRNPYYGPKMLECGEIVGGDNDQAGAHH